MKNQKLLFDFLTDNSRWLKLDTEKGKVFQLCWQGISGAKKACSDIEPKIKSGESSLARSRAEFHATCQGDDKSNYRNYLDWDDY